jgi:hypothetical protein
VKKKNTGKIKDMNRASKTGGGRGTNQYKVKGVSVAKQGEKGSIKGGRAKIGATPNKKYYTSSAYKYKVKQFDDDVEKLALKNSIQIIEYANTGGVWQGEIEPSKTITAKYKDKKDIEIFVSTLIDKYNQDSGIVSYIDKNGKGEYLEYPKEIPLKKAVNVAQELNICITYKNGKIEIANNSELKSKVKSLLSDTFGTPKLVNVTITYINNSNSKAVQKQREEDDKKTLKEKGILDNKSPPSSQDEMIDFIEKNNKK